MRVSYINNAVFTNFTMIPNELINHAALSYKAKGVLVYLLSKPKDWVVRTSDIISHGKEGEESIRSAMKELQEFGYAEKETIRNTRGEISEHIWYIYNKPTKVDKSTLSPEPGLTTSGLTTSGKSTPTNTDYTNTKNTNISRKEYVNIFGKEFELNKNHKVKFIYELEKKLIGGLEELYPKSLTGISDREQLSRLWEALHRRKGQDEWMNENPFLNLARFMEEYTKATEERLLVGTVYNLATKIRDWRMRGGKLSK